MSPDASSPYGRVVTARVTANLFDVLGVQPTLGRSFRPDEEMPGGASGVVVLTPTSWTRWFGADRTVIGRRIRLTQRQDTGTYEIIGVLPPDVTYPITALQEVEAFRPYVATAADRNHASGGRVYGLHVVGRPDREPPHTSNSTLTDFPTCMRRIASASSGAIERIFMFGLSSSSRSGVAFSLDDFLRVGEAVASHGQTSVWSPLNLMALVSITRKAPGSSSDRWDSARASIGVRGCPSW